MAVRSFNGSGDLIKVDNGAFGAINNGGAFSVVMLAYPVTLSLNKCFVSMDQGSLNMFALYTPDTSGAFNWGSDVPNADSGAAMGLTTGAWQVIGISKAGGAATPRLHRKVLGSGSWTHTDGSASVGTNAATAVNITFNAFQDGSGGWLWYIGSAAMFLSNLSDTDYVNIESNHTTAWIYNNLSPAALWDFNQASTATAVTDLTGGGANQTALSGTSVAVGNDPPGWVFGVSSAATVFQARPVAIRTSA